MKPKCEAQEILERLKMKPLPKDVQGRCHEQAIEILYALAQSSQTKGWELVNGYLVGTINHTWLEYKGWVVDWSHGEKDFVPVSEFYANRKPRVYKRYSPQEACEFISQSDVFDFGPKDPATQIAIICGISVEQANKQLDDLMKGNVDAIEIE